MKIQNISQLSVFTLLLLFTACQDSDTSIETEFKDAKSEMEKEFTQEMSENGNQEISIDDIENDLGKMDAELESIMQEMENEMDVDTTYSDSETIDTIE